MYRLEHAGGRPYSATPIGVLQRLPDLSGFTLSGNRMRRLRYLISKFENSGRVMTREYHPGKEDPALTQEIIRLADQWKTLKSQIHPFIELVKQQILEGTLNTRKRIFLTWRDDVLENVIIITRLSKANGYLMDVEFYGPDMALGGLEYGISEIIKVLVAEGVTAFSLGGTIGPKLNDSPNADPKIEAFFENLRANGDFGAGNFQFKNKFRTVNSDLWLVRPMDADPERISDVMMMYAAPDPEEQRQAPESLAPLKPPPNRPSEPEPVKTAAPLGRQAETPPADQSDPSSARTRLLEEHGFNPLNIPINKIDYDLTTDSWAQLDMPAIDARLGALQSRDDSPDLKQQLVDIFGMEHVIPVASGRMAESFLCRVLAAQKRVVAQNLLFPTWIYHQIDRELTPEELPVASAFRLEDPELFKGNLDVARLARLIDRDPAALAFVCVELANNAAGGYPISMANLDQIRALLQPHRIPLVLDATRIVENAYFIQAHEPGWAERDIWTIAREICLRADALTASLTKDFCVNIGGVIALRDKDLFNELGDMVTAGGSGLNTWDRKLIARTLSDRGHVAQQVRARMANVERLWRSLTRVGVSVANPNGGHCVLLDVPHNNLFADLKYPQQSFLSWMFRYTGIRAGMHIAGMQRGSALNGLVRLALPVGLSEADMDIITSRLESLFRNGEGVQDLVLREKPAGMMGGARARFEAVGPASVARAPITEPVAPETKLQAKTPVAQRSAPNAVPSGSVLSKTRPRPALDAVAIVGVAGKFPGGVDLDAFWRGLEQGRDLLSEIPDGRWDAETIGAASRRAGFLPEADCFDCRFFGISPREAELMDPQQRLLLETVWHCIENAGYPPGALAGTRTALFTAVAGADYRELLKAGGVEVEPHVLTGNNHSIMVNRVSYLLDLRGPSEPIDNACASSLVAVHKAVEAVRFGGCAMAIAAGVNFIGDPWSHLVLDGAGVLSGQGRCRPFDKDGDGYARGEGAAAVLVKPLGGRARRGRLYSRGDPRRRRRARRTRRIIGPARARWAQRSDPRRRPTLRRRAREHQSD